MFQLFLCRPSPTDKGCFVLHAIFVDVLVSVMILLLFDNEVSGSTIITHQCLRVDLLCVCVRVCVSVCVVTVFRESSA